LFDKEEEYEEKVNKAERQYNEFSQKQGIAQEQQSTVENRLREARKELKNLEEKESWIPSLITELDNLFSRVFDDGSTGFFLEDDRLKDAIHTAEERRDEIQAKIQSESQAKKELDFGQEYTYQYLARVLFAEAQTDAALARRDEAFARRDKALKKRAKAEKVEPLKRAAALTQQEYVDNLHALDSEKSGGKEVVSQLEKFVRNAIQASPLVNPITRLGAYVPTAKWNTKQLIAEFTQYAQHLTTESSNAQLRVEEAEKKLESALRILDRSREEQLRARKTAFDSYIINLKGWDSILTIAKNNVKRHVAVVHAFPEREKFEASLILTNTMEQYREEHQLEDRKSYILTDH